ncbi:HD domain-containing protein [Nanoarchaeota archaeon]
MIPTREECVHLMDKFKTPIGIRKHSIVVNKIAVFLAKKLKAADIDIDVGIVDAASFLHDLVRQVNFHSFDDATHDEVSVWRPLKEIYSHMDHADMAAELLKNKYPIIGQVIAKHGCHAVLNDEVDTWEEKVVAYADRRVIHNRISSIEKRYEDLSMRHEDFYMRTELDPKKEKQKMLKIEKSIFGHLKFTPEQLEEEMAK